ncbi:MAG TPA: MOSC N-terminal beta barrel domain-containing protein [Chitinophagaceae bacterium]|nr:MOSC N-terminal beta barrel domain-containing protein [Chitinophagaceae bacterium]
MFTISQLNIYPIKSLGGISLNVARLTDRGLQYDRRWMLVDINNRFITQREFPVMSLLQVGLTQEGLKIYHKKISGETLFIPFQPQSSEMLMVEVWEDKCEAQLVSHEADEWFSDMLVMQCRLVYMPDTTNRNVDSSYAMNKEITSFSDGYPMLMIGQSSLDDLNNRLSEPLPMNRFRPNIVFTGGKPFEEDAMEHFVINKIDFFGVKLCSRCVVTTIDQDEATKAKEPLKTLATYRMQDNNVYFGQNLSSEGEGEIHTGDIIEIKTRKQYQLR